MMSSQRPFNCDRPMGYSHVRCSPLGCRLVDNKVYRLRKRICYAHGVSEHKLYDSKVASISPFVLKLNIS